MTCGAAKMYQYIGGAALLRAPGLGSHCIGT